MEWFLRCCEVKVGLDLKTGEEKIKEEVEMSLGDLVVILTEEITSFVSNEEEAGKLVADILTGLWLYESGSISASWH
jgi:hypothetical protein